MINERNAPVYRKSNGTYVITRAETGDLDYWCGFPDDPNGCHAEVQSYLAEHPEALVPEPVPPPPTPEQIKAQRIAQIKARLGEIDLETARPGRAVSLGIQTKADTDKLAELESEASDLRLELQPLLR